MEKKYLHTMPVCLSSNETPLEKKPVRPWIEGRLRQGLTGAATLAAALTLTVTDPRPAGALDAYSALSFRDSIGVNSVLSETSSTSRYTAVKDALRDIGIVNHRAKLTPYNAGRARDLYQCCGIKTLARIDVREGGGKVGKADPTGIPQELNAALGAGSQAISAFEGPNEYTSLQSGPGWDDDLRVYMQRLADEVRGRKLPQPVVGPTIYLRKPMHINELGNIGGSIDASNFHIYTSGNEPSYKIDEFLSNARIMAPGKPVWVTEYGYHNALKNPKQNPVSELTAAKYIPRFAALYFGRSPQGKFFVYEFIDDANNPADREANFGILRNNLQKKPVYYTLKRMINVVKTGSTAVSPRDLNVNISGGGNIQKLLLQQSSNQYLLLLWQEVKVWDVKAQRQISVPDQPVTVTIPTNAAFSLYDTLPNEADASKDAAPAQLGSGRRSVTFNVPDHIVLLQMKL